jgi:hypothetical protein
MRPRVDLPYVGPLKKGVYARSESPLEEVWNWIARFGISEWLKRNCQQVAPLEDWGPYATVRVRQAVEFRAAARNISILTRPLPLYYSSLNLLRGFNALGQGVKPNKSRHGLTFTGEDEANFFKMGAKFCEGTFTEFLRAQDVPYQKDTEITLGQALSRIVEMAGNISPSVGPDEVFRVDVEAWYSGKIRLHFRCPPGQETLFPTNWQEWFPQFKDLCSLEPAGAVLIVDKQQDEITSREGIVDFLHRTLEVNLSSYEDPAWFAIRHAESKFGLPREAFYFIGAFILSSAVRYKPESLLAISNPDSETGWIVARFLNAAERYFPHLLLNWVYRPPVYF